MNFNEEDSSIILEAAYEVYINLINDAFAQGHIEDPLGMVSFFLGLHIAENIMYQKLVDNGCTIASIEQSREKINRISQDIIASVKGKMVQNPPDEKV
jgi:hypothetical protein